MLSRIVLSVILVAAICPFDVARAQSQVRQHQEKLRRIRDEIMAMEKRLKANERKETSVLTALANLDLEIDLTQSVIQNLRNEEKKKAREIARIEKDLKTNREELARLKARFSKRLVYTYKYGRMKDLELLLTARSLNDGLLWLEYQKRLSENDYRNYIKIKDKQARIERDRDLLTIELQRKRRLLQDKLREEKKIKEKKRQRQQVLASIRRDADLLRQQLQEKENAAAEIRRIISRLEENRTQEPPLVRPDVLFSDLRGRMLWPAEGKIITHFGRFKHPELNTVTENIGIEIKAPLQTPVHTVASGKVTTITWQRGRGNIIIISHYGGYYTVYTHLGEIWVDLHEEVEAGQVIGTVGESGSLKGPILHFEIWHGTEKLDPELWLAKR
ncbi:MAG: hypothetical protein D6743_15260 [Calditrichaeota bacterium]|nr:MAG: hypothetical protein D6743_15260 [Calditrichota bacterium]